MRSDEGRRRRRDRKTNRRGERRMRRGPMDCPLRRGRGQDGSVSPAGDPISFSGKEMGERNRQREPIPKAVPFGIPPHRPGGCGPLEIPQGFTGDDGRRTGGLDGSCGLPQPLAGLRNDERRGMRNTAGPVGRFDRQAPIHWNHTTLFFPLPNRSPSERVRFGDGVIPASSPRPAPGPKARRACCRREAGGSPARSPAWRR